MAGEPALKLKILTELDKSGMEKEIAQLKKSFDTGIVNQLQTEIKVLKKAIGQGTDEKQLKPLIEMKRQAQEQLFNVTGGEYGKKMPPLEVKTPPEQAGFFKGILQGIGPLLSMITKISLGAMLGAAIFEVIKPAINVVNSIMKLLAEFFRPLMYIALSLLLPILNLLKPILAVFNSIFAPFKAAIMKLNAQASIDIAKGMINNDPALMAKGIATSLLAAGLGLAGFSKAMLEVGLQLLKLATTASAQLLTLLMKLISWGFAMLIGVFSDKTAKKFMGVMGTVGGGLESTVANINDFLSNALNSVFDIVLGTFVWGAEKLGVDISEELEPAISGISLGDAVKTFISNEKAIFKDVASTVVGIIKGDFDEMFENMDLSTSFDTFKDMIVTNFDKTLKKSQEELALLSLGDDINKNLPKGATYDPKTGEYIDPNGLGFSVAPENMGNFLDQQANPLQGLMDNIYTGAKETTSLITPEFATMNTMMADTSQTMSTKIPAEYTKGLDIMYNGTSFVMGEKGTAVNTYTGGMTKLTSATDTFAQAAEKSANIVLNAVTNMNKYASLYYAALNKIESMKRVNATRNG